VWQVSKFILVEILLVVDVEELVVEGFQRI
jgi:hypothetical protein